MKNYFELASELQKEFNTFLQKSDDYPLSSTEISFYQERQYHDDLSLQINISIREYRCPGGNFKDVDTLSMGASMYISNNDIVCYFDSKYYQKKFNMLQSKGDNIYGSFLQICKLNFEELLIDLENYKTEKCYCDNCKELERYEVMERRRAYNY